MIIEVRAVPVYEDETDPTYSGDWQDAEQTGWVATTREGWTCNHIHESDFEAEECPAAKKKAAE